MIGVIFPDTKRNFNLAEDLQVVGSPILDHQLEWLNAQPEIDKILIVTPKKYQKEHGLTKPIIYCVCPEESIDNIAPIKEFLRDEPFFAIFGNFLTDFNLTLLKSEFIAKRSDICFLYGEKEKLPEGYFIKLDKNHKLRDFKYNSGNYLSVFQNIFLISPELMEYVSQEDNISFYERFLPEMLHRNKFINGLKNKNTYFSFSDPTSWYKANYLLLQQNKVIVGSKINNIYYGDKCDIDFSVDLTGEQFFGNNCQIAKNCKITNSLLFDNVKVGQNVIINNSIVCANATIREYSALESAVIGENTLIEAHVRINTGTVLAKDSTINKNSGVLNV
jgi:NDP-sugar pyrophosphorylase family protein